MGNDRGLPYGEVMGQHQLDVAESFPTLRREGFGFIDVGARDGIHPMFRDAAPLLHAVGFEPDREEYDRLQAQAVRPNAQRMTYVPVALGESDQERPFYLCRSRGTSSFLTPNRTWLERFPDPERYDVVMTQSVAVRSLDGLVDDPAVSMPSSIDFLKIDAQGAALEVLKGARRTLHRQVMGLEVEFARVYDAQPVFRDVDAFLSECGFTLFKLRRKAWVRRTCQRRPQVSAGQLIAADALYLRDPFELPEETTSAWKAHQVEALVLIASLYDLNDFALEILAHPCWSAWLEGDAVRRFIEQRSRRLDYTLRNGALATLTPAVKILRECFRGRAGMGNLYAWSVRRS